MFISFVLTTLFIGIFYFIISLILTDMYDKHIVYQINFSIIIGALIWIGYKLA